MATPALSTAQLAAQLDAVLERPSSALAVAIHAPVPVGLPDVMVRKGRTFRLRWCESLLAMREALAGVDPDGPAEEGLVLLTPLSDGQLPDDVAARLHRERVFQPKGWEILRQLFAVNDIDARLVSHDWMPQLLIESADGSGFAPLASGFLDLDSAWREVLARGLNIDSARPDAADLMRWGLRPDSLSLLGVLPARARNDVFQWLSSHAGATGALVVRCIEAGRGADAAALGVACEVLYCRDAEGSPALAQAAVRLERYVGDRHVGIAEGRDWAAQTQRLLRMLPPEQARAVLDRADALLRELRVAEYASLSDWVPSGLEQRLAQLADVLLTHAAAPSEISATQLEAATSNSLRHQLLAQQPLRAERVEMARRLGRWLMHAPPAPTGLEGQVARHADDGAWVDWARFRLLGGDELPKLSTAYGALRAAVAARREALNRAFAATLAAQLKQAQVTGGRCVPLELVLEQLVAPLAGSQPVMLLVVDGLSVAIFRELFERSERHGWVELVRDEIPQPLLGLAALPTITEVSRSSLLCGKICLGTASAERTGFAAHPALLANSAASMPPRLFHKGELQEGGNLAEDVRKALANTTQKIVGVVYNAVDDHLSGPDQLHQRWRLEELRLLMPLLREARDARRVLIVTADHGHVLEESSSLVPGGQSDRWRAGNAATDSREVALAGSRVLGPQGGNAVVCLWSEAARYTGRKNGYHGGASPAEAVVPLSVFAPHGVKVSGWMPAPPQQPEWWDLPEPVTPQATAPVNPKVAARKALAPAVGQAALFEDEAQPIVSSTAADWVSALFNSPVYAAQRQLAARVSLQEDQMRRLLVSLDERGGKLSRAALAQRLGIAELRLAGVLSAARRMLNVDQELVLNVDESSGTVELNRSLLLRQFRLEGFGVAP